MNVLAMDTSSSFGSLALMIDGKIVFYSGLNIQKTHSERIMPLLEQAFTACDFDKRLLDKIILSIGPGSFTGIRIGLATAKGLSYGLKIPLVPVCTLKMYALNLYGGKNNILVMNDGKMQEAYCALYSPALEEIIPPHASAPADFLQEIKDPVTIIGDYEIFLPLIENSGLKAEFAPKHLCVPNACSLLSFVDNANHNYDYETIANLEPLYLRKSQAEIAKERSI